MNDWREHMGKTVKDATTGFIGTLTGVCYSWKGSTRVLVEGLDAAARPVSEWIEDARVELVEAIQPNGTTQG